MSHSQCLHSACTTTVAVVRLFQFELHNRYSTTVVLHVIFHDFFQWLSNFHDYSITYHFPWLLHDQAFSMTFPWPWEPCGANVCSAEWRMCPLSPPLFKNDWTDFDDIWYQNAQLKDLLACKEKFQPTNNNTAKQGSSLKMQGTVPRPRTSDDHEWKSWERAWLLHVHFSTRGYHFDIIKSPHWLADCMTIFA